MNLVVMHKVDEDVDENFAEILFVFEKLILDMVTKDLSKRISLISAIKYLICE